MTTDVLLYTTNWCPFCRRAKALLKEKGVCEGRCNFDHQCQSNIDQGLEQPL